MIVVKAEAVVVVVDEDAEEEEEADEEDEVPVGVEGMAASIVAAMTAMLLTKVIVNQK